MTWTVARVAIGTAHVGDARAGRERGRIRQGSGVRRWQRDERRGRRVRQHGRARITGRRSCQRRADQRHGGQLAVRRGEVAGRHHEPVAGGRHVHIDEVLGIGRQRRLGHIAMPGRAVLGRPECQARCAGTWPPCTPAGARRSGRRPRSGPGAAPAVHQRRHPTCCHQRRPAPSAARPRRCPARRSWPPSGPSRVRDGGCHPRSPVKRSIFQVCAVLGAPQSRGAVARASSRTPRPRRPWGPRPRPDPGRPRRPRWRSRRRRCPRGATAMATTPPAAGISMRVYVAADVEGLIRACQRPGLPVRAAPDGRRAAPATRRGCRRGGSHPSVPTIVCGQAPESIGPSALKLSGVGRRSQERPSSERQRAGATPYGPVPVTLSGSDSSPAEGHEAARPVGHTFDADLRPAGGGREAAQVEPGRVGLDGLPGRCRPRSPRAVPSSAPMSSPGCALAGPPTDGDHARRSDGHAGGHAPGPLPSGPGRRCSSRPSPGLAGPPRRGLPPAGVPPPWAPSANVPCRTTPRDRERLDCDLGREDGPRSTGMQAVGCPSTGVIDPRLKVSSPG